MKISVLAAAIAIAVSAPAFAINVIQDDNAINLVSAIGGSGVTITNASLTSNTVKPSGTFTGGLNSVGFDTGIVLTTGTTDCVAGPNNGGGCTGGGSSTSLKFDFESTTGQVFFKYVFASEEYTQYVGSSFNDTFELRLPVRQWALSVPKRIRYFMLRDEAVLTMVLRILLRVIAQSPEDCRHSFRHR